MDKQDGFLDFIFDPPGLPNRGPIIFPSLFHIII